MTIEVAGEAAIEREAVVKWLHDTAATARRMFPKDRRLAVTLMVNADGIARGDHRRPPSQRVGVGLDDIRARFGGADHG
ncbi:MAG TPA: hypothetical protein VF680_11535 [Allosphingosinicella sp.]|jgi:hypothetical protein